MYLADEHKIWVCKGEDKICMLPKMANRHGLIAGATGTGKTVTLKVLAESFSEMGVPVFLADIKGDVSGMCKAGESSEGFQKRLHKLGIENFEFKGFPVRFFDVFGKKGHPVRTTISEMGPDLLSRLLELNTTQSGIMTIIFKIADDQGLLLSSKLPMAMCRLRVSARSSGLCCAWKNRAEMCFSASRHWTSGTGWQWQMTDAVISIFCIA